MPAPYVIVDVSLRDRLTGVSRAAAQQARRPRLPAISGPVIPTAIGAQPDRLLLVAHPGDGALTPVDAVADADGIASVSVLIGPEGGWSAKELAHFVAQGATKVRLGPTALRSCAPSMPRPPRALCSRRRSAGGEHRTHRPDRYRLRRCVVRCPHSRVRSGTSRELRRWTSQRRPRTKPRARSPRAHR